MMESIAESIQQQQGATLQRKNSTSSMMSTSSLEVAQINGTGLMRSHASSKKQLFKEKRSLSSCHESRFF